MLKINSQLNIYLSCGLSCSFQVDRNTEVLNLEITGDLFTKSLALLLTTHTLRS